MGSRMMIVNPSNITASSGAGLVALLLVSGGFYFIISADSSDAMGGVGNYTVVAEERSLWGPDETEYISDGETLEIFYTWDEEVPEGFHIYMFEFVWFYEENDEETNPNGPVEQASCFADPGENALDSTQGELNHDDFFGGDDVSSESEFGDSGIGWIEQPFSDGNSDLGLWLWDESTNLTFDNETGWKYNFTGISEGEIHENLTTNGKHTGDYSMSISLDAEVGGNSGCPHSDEGEEVRYYIAFRSIKYNILPTDEVFPPSE